HPSHRLSHSAADISVSGVVSQKGFMRRAYTPPMPRCRPPLSSPFHGEGDRVAVEGATPPSAVACTTTIAAPPPPSRRWRAAPPPHDMGRRDAPYLQCVTLFENRLLTTTPPTIITRPTTAGTSSFCLNRARPITEISTTPSPLHMA